nr:MAG TPA: hypothetical protein [Bacteriophage sp.]
MISSILLYTLVASSTCDLRNEFIFNKLYMSF